MNSIRHYRYCRYNYYANRCVLYQTLIVNCFNVRFKRGRCDFLIRSKTLQIEPNLFECKLKLTSYGNLINFMVIAKIKSNIRPYTILTLTVYLCALFCKINIQLCKTEQNLQFTYKL